MGSEKSCVRQCQISNCENEYYSLGLCRKHYDAERYSRDKNQRRIARKQRYAINPEKELKKNREYRSNNKEAINRHRRDRYQNDIQFKIAHNIRKRYSRAIRSTSKKISAVHDMGCSLEELITYLESKFQPGMSWQNYGKWHVDHIVPLVKFDLARKDEALKACHYTNLQPLWAHDNFVKGAR